MKGAEPPGSGALTKGATPVQAALRLIQGRRPTTRTPRAKTPKPCLPRPYTPGRKGKLCPKPPYKPRDRRPRGERQVNTSHLTFCGQKWYLYPPLSKGQASFKSLYNKCFPPPKRPTQRQIAAIAATYRGDLKESRKINDLVRNILNSDGKSQIPTVTELIGPDPPKPKYRTKPSAPATPQPAPRSVPPGAITATDHAGPGRCDTCAPLAGPFLCPVQICSGPSGVYFLVGSRKITQKSLTPNTIDELIRIVNGPQFCGKPKGQKEAQEPRSPITFKAPPGLTPAPTTPPTPGMIKQPIGKLIQPTETTQPGPVTPGLLPGQLPGEICVGSGAPAKIPVWLCSGPGGHFYVAAGNRRLVSSFGSIDAVIIWANTFA